MTIAKKDVLHEPKGPSSFCKRKGKHPLAVQFATASSSLTTSRTLAATSLIFGMSLSCYNSKPPVSPPCNMTNSRAHDTGSQCSCKVAWGINSCKLACCGLSCDSRVTRSFLSPTVYGADKRSIVDVAWYFVLQPETLPLWHFWTPVIWVHICTSYITYMYASCPRCSDHTTALPLMFALW